MGIKNNTYISSIVKFNNNNTSNILNICCHPINNFTDICLNIDCQKHKHYTHPCNYKKNQYSCKNNYRCNYKYNLDKIIKKYPYLKDINIFKTTIKCGNYTNNSTRLCDCHNIYICPCIKHSSYIPKKYFGIYKTFGQILLNQDIYSNIFHFLNYYTKKLLNCTNKYFNNFYKNFTSLQSTKLINRDTKDNIIYYIRTKISLINSLNSKEEKILHFYEIYDYLIYNKQFLIDHFQFSITVLNKLIENKNECIQKYFYYLKNLFNINQNIINKLIKF